MSEETWRPVPGYEGLYEVSDAGSVRSLERLVLMGRGEQTRIARSCILSPSIDRKGYLKVQLCRDGDRVFRKVHHLVLEAFAGPRPAGMQACHANDVAGDNRLTNLRWDTPSANARDKVRNGRNHQRRKTHCSSGHRFDEANTYLTIEGWRMCRTCSADRSRARRARQRQRNQIRGAA